MVMMRFTWNEAKRKSILKEHRLDFSDAHKGFDGPTFTFEDRRSSYGERRWVSLGLLDQTVVVIVHTESVDLIRVISMRKAERSEKILFVENL